MLPPLLLPAGALGWLDDPPEEGVLPRSQPPRFQPPPPMKVGAPQDGPKRPPPIPGPQEAAKA